MSLDEQQKKILDAIIEEHAEFQDAVFGTPDAVSQVLRLHALTEYYLEQMICIMLKKGEIVARDSRFSYRHKLQIVSALDILDSSMIGVLRKLSKLRNGFAHQRTPIVILEEIHEMALPLGKGYLELLEQQEREPKELNALSRSIFYSLSQTVSMLKMVPDYLAHELLKHNK